MNTIASSDEKIMAALAHGSVLLMFLGPIVPVIVWASQRKKSKYVSFHALQAMGYQAFYFWLWIFVFILMMILFICLIPVLGVFMERSRGDTAILPFLVQLPVLLTIFGFFGVFFILGLAGAVTCLLGRDFRYPFLGRWLERYLSYNTGPESPINEAQEDHWVAGICHATAILQLWGVVTPLIVWFTQKERSAHLRFQSLQAAVYQIIAFVAYMLGTAVYMAFFFGMFLTLIFRGTIGGRDELQGPPALMMVGFLIVMIIFWIIMMIVMPLYYLLAGLAAFQVIRGHYFRYPILGKMIEKRMEPALSPEAGA